MERDNFLETPIKFTDIVYAKKAKGEIIIEELRIRVTTAEALDEITAVRAPREDRATVVIAPSLENQGPVKLKEESYYFKSSSDSLDIAKIISYLIMEILYLVYVVNRWFLPYKRQI